MIEFIVNNGDRLLALAAGLVAVASALAALTPTPKDDGIALALRRLIDLIALNVGHARRKP
ncbi:hypothetical protein D3874_01645 [Oleomonas cavernae]|uniref:Uncharacterized protein n=1 Tax=Oleomonas cavernae TaxID=2320859 RepID=A0A418WTP4_9PROT|nr:hypothetical protein [Oleomonas cavernae]RJF94567.1 hypothetical protein D3874_01645 [Oleomonas cavernae]